MLEHIFCIQTQGDAQERRRRRRLVGSGADQIRAGCCLGQIQHPPDLKGVLLPVAQARDRVAGDVHAINPAARNNIPLPVASVRPVAVLVVVKIVVRGGRVPGEHHLERGAGRRREARRRRNGAIQIKHPHPGIGRVAGRVARAVLHRRGDLTAPLAQVVVLQCHRQCRRALGRPEGHRPLSRGPVRQQVPVRILRHRHRHHERRRRIPAPGQREVRRAGILIDGPADCLDRHPHRLRLRRFRGQGERAERCEPRPGREPPRGARQAAPPTPRSGQGDGPGDVPDRECRTGGAAEARGHALDARPFAAFGTGAPRTTAPARPGGEPLLLAGTRNHSALPLRHPRADAPYVGSRSVW